MSRPQDHVLTFIEPKTFLEYWERLEEIVSAAETWADAKCDPQATELLEREDALLNSVLLFQEERRKRTGDA